jgi:hypothetical protein
MHDAMASTRYIIVHTYIRRCSSANTYADVLWPIRFRIVHVFVDRYTYVYGVDYVLYHSNFARGLCAFSSLALPITKLYPRIHASTHAHMHAYVHTYIRTCVRTYVHTYIHACLCMYYMAMHVCVCSCVHVHQCMYGCMCTYACMHACVRPTMYAYVRPHMHRCAHPIHALGHMYTCAHTFIHTYIYIQHFVRTHKKALYVYLCMYE